MGKSGSYCVLIGALLAMAISPAAADGAIAIGATSAPEDGVAYGAVVNSPTSAEARAVSLKRCRSYSPAPAAADACASVSTFKNRCYALALDPKAGMPGFGWSLDRTKDAARQQALENCKNVAGEDRRDFCRVIESDCDEN